VIRQGENSTYVLFVLSGCVKVVVHSEFGRDVLIDLRGRGDLVGETTILDHDVRAANVETCTPTTAKLVRGNEFAELVERNAEIRGALSTTIGQQLRLAQQRYVELVACPASQRVVRALVEIAYRYGTALPDGHARDIPLNQQEIASLAGVALSTVEKVLHLAQAESLVSRHYRRIVVKDPVRLRRFGELTYRNPY
jgi:CRP-like cAMP-binding protein